MNSSGGQSLGKAITTSFDPVNTETQDFGSDDEYFPTDFQPNNKLETLKRKMLDLCRESSSPIKTLNFSPVSRVKSVVSSDEYRNTEPSTMSFGLSQKSSKNTSVFQDKPSAFQESLQRSCQQAIKKLHHQRAKLVSYIDAVVETRTLELLAQLETLLERGPSLQISAQSTGTSKHTRERFKPDYVFDITWPGLGLTVKRCSTKCVETQTGFAREKLTVRLPDKKKVWVGVSRYTTVQEAIQLVVHEARIEEKRYQLLTFSKKLGYTALKPTQVIANIKDSTGAKPKFILNLT